MTTLLYDVHWQEDKREDYPEGVDFGEVLYADDTILIGTDHKELERILRKIKKTKSLSYHWTEESVSTSG